MKRIIYISLFLLNFMFGYDEIILNDIQMQKLGIGITKPDFSEYYMIGPFASSLDFSNQASIKQVSPFEITISNIKKFEGDYVKKGDVICNIISDSLSNLVYEYKNTESKYQIAQNNVKKDKELFESGVISQREYQNSYLLANELELKLKDLDSIIKQIGINPNAQGFGYPVIAQISGILAVGPSKSAQKVEAFSPYIIITNDNSKMQANIKIPQNNALDIQKNAKVFIKDKNTKIEIGNINSVSIAIDTDTNTINATANINYKKLQAGSNIDTFILVDNPKDTIAITRDVVTKIGNDSIVFVKTQNGFMPTKIEIVKEINNGFLIKKDNFGLQTNLANGSIIVLKGAMSGLSFE
ncbi:efflux RND transporter periplasmic adaptor subunit [Helicobacter sp. MIT 99-5507]|uniref:efflux RND transporter periplasmic adaptor subunit n=1 Tax=Helicobacter sp. MIT 99-5507 TaxID=152489 RepID=UPI000E1F2E4B|nr:sodium:proton antiporter [Helicobacter sp. MIT 99-5507]RDU56515.1 sodium:proton antiporter [Helicobacter sp. MIT 99-5507]